MNDQTPIRPRPRAGRLELVDEARARELIALFGRDAPVMDDDTHRAHLKSICLWAVGVLRARWASPGPVTSAPAVIDDDYYGVLLAGLDYRDLPARIQDLMQAALSRMYEVIDSGEGGDFERLAEHPTAAILTYGRRHEDREESQVRARSTQLVDGPNGPEMRRVYANRKASLDGSGVVAVLRDASTSSFADAEHWRWLRDLMRLALQVATPVHRHTLRRRLRGASLKQASKGTGMSEETVRRNHIALLEKVHSTQTGERVVDGRTRKKGRRSARTGEREGDVERHPDHDAGEGRPSPKKQRGD